MSEDRAARIEREVNEELAKAALRGPRGAWQQVTAAHEGVTYEAHAWVSPDAPGERLDAATVAALRGASR